MMNGLTAALAYINPGTGSLFWQFLLVGIAGAWASFRTCSQWIKGRASRKGSEKKS